MTTKKFYKPYDEIPGYGQEFDIKHTTYKKCGKEINVFDEIQANREDTEIIPTLRKYGNLKPLEIDAEGMYGEFKAMNLEDAYAVTEKAQELYDQLPAEIKKIFNDDPKEFLNKAPKWLEEKIQTVQPTTPTNEKTEGVGNEQSAN